MAMNTVLIVGDSYFSPVFIFLNEEGPWASRLTIIWKSVSFSFSKSMESDGEMIDVIEKSFDFMYKN